MVGVLPSGGTLPVRHLCSRMLLVENIHKITLKCELHVQQRGYDRYENVTNNYMLSAPCIQKAAQM